jgi:hypothetical protein
VHTINASLSVHVLQSFLGRVSTVKMGILGFTTSYLAFSVLHFFQFALAITVCGLYGVDLHRAAQAGKYQDSKWVCFPPLVIIESSASANPMVNRSMLSSSAASRLSRHSSTLSPSSCGSQPCGYGILSSSFSGSPYLVSSERYANDLSLFGIMMLTCVTDVHP